MAFSLSSLAALYQAQGRYVLIESLYGRSLAILDKALGPDHPIVATSLNNLAALYQTEGDYANAELLAGAFGRPGQAAAAAINKLAVRLGAGTDRLAQLVRRDEDLTTEC